MGGQAGIVRGFFRRKIVFGVASVWGAQAVTLFAGIFSMPLFFKYLAQEELGLWMFILGAWFFANLADMGFSPVLGRQLAFELGKGDRGPGPNYAGASYYFSLSRHVSIVTSRILFAGMLFIGAPFLLTLGLPEGLMHSSIEAWAIFCLAQAVTCRFKYLETALNSHGEAGWQNWVQASVQLAALAGYFMALRLGGGIVALSAVVLGRNALNAFFLRLLVRSRIDGPFTASVKVSWHDVKPHIRPALDFFMISLGGFLVFNTDQYFIVEFLGSSALPDYAAAYRLVQVFYVFSSSISETCMPFISRRSVGGDHAGIHRMLMLNTTVGMMVQIAAVSVLAVFGDYIIRLWLGRGHFVGWGVLWVFCITLTLENHHVIFARFGLSSKTEPVWGKMALFSGAVNLVLTFIGVRWLGLLGVALGTTAAQLLTNNWYAVMKTMQMVEMRFLNYLNGSGIVWLASALVLPAAMASIRFLVPWPAASLLAGVLTTGLLSSVVIYVYLRRHQAAGL